MLKHVDLATEKIYAFPGVPLISAEISRFVVDVNRRRNDFSEKGVIIRRSWDGLAVWKEKPSRKEIEFLLKKYYDPFYAKIEKALEGKENVLLLDGHSMNPFGGRNSIDPGKVRPDICLASNHLTTCSKELVLELKELLEKEGYWVELDKPYSGRKAGIINFFSVPGKIDALLFEVNKKLYMSNITNPGSIDEERIEKLRQDIWQALQKVL